VGRPAGTSRIQALEKEIEAAAAKAESYVDSNAYPRIIEENGGAGLNASTGEDATEYYYSLPSNRIELWFLLESERFLHPVFREFFKERDVVREERRMRVESDPQGKLTEMLLATAFAAHPYRKPTAGWASDIEHLRVGEARAFFNRYYVPKNITIAIAGDVNPARAKELAGKYFSRLPARPLPHPLTTVEPPQTGEKRIAIETPAQPFMAIAYKRPDQLDNDDPVFDVIAAILDSSRTGLLYRSLVRDKRIALAAMAASTFPGGKYPNLFLMYVAPNSGHSVAENEQAVYEVIDRLKREKVDEETLARVKAKVRAGLIRQLDSNSGMASNLTFYEVNYGDWRKMFAGLEDIDRVTAADVQRVVRRYFVESGRTVAFTVQPQAAAKGEGK
jgi:predicted Zn-dependent peptidase